MIQKSLIISTKETWDERELAWWLDISPEEIADNIGAGVLRRARDGRFPAVESLLAFEPGSVWRSFLRPRRWPKPRRRG